MMSIGRSVALIAILGATVAYGPPPLPAQTEGPLEVKIPPRRRPKPAPRPAETPTPAPRAAPRPPAEQAEPSPCPAGFIPMPRRTAQDRPPRLTREPAPDTSEPAEKAAAREEETECVWVGEGNQELSGMVAASHAVSNLPPELMLASLQIDEFSQELPNFICDQLTERYASNSTPRRWKLRDRISAEVLYLDGKEEYQNIRRNGKPLKTGSPRDSGSWSTGEYGSTLRDVFSPLTQAAFKPRGESEIAGHMAAVYDFTVEQPNSHWLIDFEGHKIYPAYKGSVWIDPETHQVRRIEMQARDVPPTYPMDVIESTVDYGPVRIGGEEYLMTTRSENLACKRYTKACSRNEIHFRDYRKFSAESTILMTDSSITYEGEPAPAGEGQPEEKREEAKP